MINDNWLYVFLAFIMGYGAGKGDLFILALAFLFILGILTGRLKEKAR